MRVIERKKEKATNSLCSGDPTKFTNYAFLLLPDSLQYGLVPF